MIYVVTHIIAFAFGLLFYAKLLDKPETVVNGKIKQRKGLFKNIFRFGSKKGGS